MKKLNLESIEVEKIKLNHLTHSELDSVLGGRVKIGFDVGIGGGELGISVRDNGILVDGHVFIRLPSNDEYGKDLMIGVWGAGFISEGFGMAGGGRFVINVDSPPLQLEPSWNYTYGL